VNYRSFSFANHIDACNNLDNYIVTAPSKSFFEGY